MRGLERRWRAAFALGGALLLAGCGDRAGLDRLAALGQGKVARVLGGDAVVLADGRTVRLAGVVAPGAGQAYHDQAVAALSGLVAGREVDLLSGGATKDAYGRVLAQLRRRPDGLWVQGALLDAGAARVRTYADNRALAAPMLEREAGARRKAVGLWALPSFQVLLPQEAARARDFAVVEGRVADVRAGRYGEELALSDGGPGIVLTIPPRAAGDFVAAGKPLLPLKGRLVRARGDIWSDGTMRLDHPELLEVLKQTPPPKP